MPRTRETTSGMEQAMHRAVAKSRSKPKGRASEAPGAIGGATGVAISAEERHRMIAAAAYYRAERRGFAPGGELEDWCASETEIDQLLKRV